MKSIGLPNKEDSDEEMRDKYEKQLLDTAAEKKLDPRKKSSLASITEVGENPPVP